MKKRKFIRALIHSGQESTATSKTANRFLKMQLITDAIKPSATKMIEALQTFLESQR